MIASTVLLFVAMGALVCAALAVIGHATLDYAVMLLAIIVFVERIKKEEP